MISRTGLPKSKYCPRCCPSRRSCFCMNCRELAIGDDQPVVAAGWNKRPRYRSDQGGDGSRVANGPQRKTQSSQHPIFGGSIQLVAQLRHGVAPDGDELSHQHAP